MSKFLSVNLIGLLCTSLFFVGNTFAQQHNAKADLQVKLQQLKTYQADFKQTVLDIDKTVLQEASGHIELQQPNKLYWELLAPNDSILLADGETLWNIDPFMEQVVAYQQDSAIENNPLILLTDPSSNKWQEFSVSLENNQFTIRSLKPTASIETLNLQFDANDKLIRLETIDVQKQVSTLTFSNISQNQKLNANKFTFAMPEGYELDDQRSL